MPHSRPPPAGGPARLGQAGGRVPRACSGGPVARRRALRGRAPEPPRGLGAFVALLLLLPCAATASGSAAGVRPGGTAARAEADVASQEPDTVPDPANAPRETAAPAAGRPEAVPGTADTLPASRAASSPPRVLDVPYLPQSEALCGGAAAAMVMRYWGADGVRPTGFAHLVDAAAGGIRSDRLVDELGARGWRAHPFRGRLDDLRRHVERGRPVTVLLEVGPGRYHYVVVVAVPDGEVLFHDPADAPFQTLGRDEFLSRWSAADRWALVLLPPEGETEVDARRPAGDLAAGGACAAAVRTAVRRATEGDEAAADSLLRRAAARCPASPAPRRELAGLRFRQQRWSEAAAQARKALAAAPADSQAAHLLAASRYMQDDETAALAAWNRVDRPRVASVRVYGLDRTRWEHVAPRIGVSEGELLTPGRLALARRRAASVPAFDRVRVRYRPRADGRADLQVAVVERPLVFGSPLEAAAAALASLPQRELRLAASGLAGAGETWAGSWRWWENRPAVRLEAAFPAAFGAHGRWEVGARWERETFGTVRGTDAKGAATTRVGESARESPPLRRVERATAGLSFSRWATGGLRWEAGFALDRWEGRQAYVRPSAGLELRSGDDRAAVRGEAAAWAGLDETQLFPRAAVEAAWRAAAPEAEAGTGLAVDLRAGAAAVAAEAPLSLWPGAGTGDARPHLLRAHPLLEDGSVVGAAFGRVLAHGGVEARAWLITLGPVRIGAAGFLDAARAWDRPAALAVPSDAAGRVPGPGGGAPRAAGFAGAGDPGLLLDAGAGLRLAPGTGAGHLRVDVAGGLLDDAGAVSVGWRAPWPGW